MRGHTTAAKGLDAAPQLGRPSNCHCSGFQRSCWANHSATVASSGKNSKTHPASLSQRDVGKIWHAAAGLQYSFGKRTMQGWFGSEGGAAASRLAGPAAKAVGTGAGAGSSLASSMSV